jgi:hypothetical protein
MKKSFACFGKSFHIAKRAMSALFIGAVSDLLRGGLTLIRI